MGYKQFHIRNPPRNTARWEGSVLDMDSYFVIVFSIDNDVLFKNIWKKYTP